MTLEQKLSILGNILMNYHHDLEFIEYLSQDVTSIHGLLEFCFCVEDIILVVEILYNIYK